MSYRMKYNSKFRHLQVRTLGRENCHDNIRSTKYGWDSTSCAVNPKFVAIIVDSVGGGAFLVLPRFCVGPVPMDYPTVNGHKGWVMDIAWCPHNDNVIASGSKDGLARVWMIPDNGLTAPLSQPVVELMFHKGGVNLVLWHPSALNVLVTAGSDNVVAIWNVGTGQLLNHLSSHTDILFSASFNWDGSLLVTTCRDTMIRVFEPRTGELLGSAVCHEGARPTRVIVLRQGLIFTTGYSLDMHRQYSLRSLENLDKPMVVVNVDAAIGVLFPIYDPDLNIIYLCGRGDVIIRYFELTDKAPFLHLINTIVSTEPLRGVCLMPKRGCNILIWELAKIYRLNSKGVCEIISMTMPMPGIMDKFPDDLYPDTPASVAAIKAQDWMGGLNADPKMYSFKVIHGIWKRSLSINQKANILDEQKVTCTVCGQDQIEGLTQATPTDGTVKDQLLLAFEQVMEQSKKFVYCLGRHSVVASMQEFRIRSLQDRIEAVEAFLSPGVAYNNDWKDAQPQEVLEQPQLETELPVSLNSQAFVTLMLDSLIDSLTSTQSGDNDNSESSEPNE